MAPELFRAIKVAVDTDPRPGRFLLTGSARILALRDLPDALPGRMEIVELWPFSQGEIDGTPDRFIDAVFTRGPALAHSSELRRRDYLERIVRGGYPEAVRRAPRRRAAFFESYLSTLIERDVIELSVIERRGELRRLLALLAGRSGGLLVPGTLATQSGIPRTTVNRYLELLSAVFLIKQIPAWSSGHTQRAALFHYRTKDKVEVDAVLESADGRVVGIEVKAGATVRTDDLAGLRHLADRLGSRFVAGYLLYTGGHTLPFGDRLRALPLDVLWRVAPGEG